MALRAGIQTAMRSTSPVSTQQMRTIVRTLRDTTQRFQVQNENIKQCRMKLTVTEQLAADMLDKILTTTRNVEQMSEKLRNTRAGVVKKKQMCQELNQLIDYSRNKLDGCNQTSKWAEFHVSEMDKKVLENARLVEEYNKERVQYQLRLRSVLAELEMVKSRLEEADEGVRYIETFRDQMEEEHIDEMRSLQLAIKEAQVTRNSMMAARQDAMACVVRQLVPDDEDYGQLVQDTDELNQKCINLKRRLDEQSKEMLYYHSRNHELTLKVKELTARVKEARELRRPDSSNINAHAQMWNKHPLTWFETPSVSLEQVRNFLVKTHGPEAEASVIRYLEIKAEAAESRWHNQMFQKEYVEYDKTLEILAEMYRRKADGDVKGVETEAELCPLSASSSEFELVVSNKNSLVDIISDTVSFTLSELQLCEEATRYIQPVIVDNIGEITRTKLVRVRSGLLSRLQSFFRC